MWKSSTERRRRSRYKNPTLARSDLSGGRCVQSSCYLGEVGELNKYALQQNNITQQLSNYIANDITPLHFKQEAINFLKENGYDNTQQSVEKENSTEDLPFMVVGEKGNKINQQEFRSINEESTR